VLYFPDQAIDLETAQQGYGAARGIERDARVFAGGRGGRGSGARDPRGGRQGCAETLKRVQVVPVSPREIDRGP